MKEYLRALIEEEITRGQVLKTLIPQPLEFAELESLAERCTMQIDDKIEYLEFLLQELDNRETGDFRDIYRDYRSCHRLIQTIEYFGISALYYETPEIGYLNKLIREIHREINLPLTPPAVACISTRYYYWHNQTNVVFVPVGESNFLLHLPDIFHEIGHEVIHNRKDSPQLEYIDLIHEASIKVITDHYEELRRQKKRETGPQEIPRKIGRIHAQWKAYWLEEFLCDLFALCTVGPAYAWSHLHLTAKKSENVYEFSPDNLQEHPPAEARTRMLLEGLERLGYVDEKEEFEAKWNELPSTDIINPDPDYQYAFPDDLIVQLSKIFLKGIKKSGFSVVTAEELDTMNSDTVVKTLNNAWYVFWKDTTNFRSWEEEALDKLEQIV